MSRFWVSRNDESSSESEIETTEPVLDTTQTQRRKPAHAHYAASSSSDDDERRVVRNPKERAWQSLISAISHINNSMKIGDHSQIVKDYEGLVKAVEKSNKVIEENGYPNFFVRALNDLENYVNEQLRNKISFNKLSKARASSLNTLKAKFRKMNPVWLDLIAECALNPSAFEDPKSHTQDDDSEDSDVQDDSDVPNESDDERSDFEQPIDDDDELLYDDDTHTHNNTDNNRDYYYQNSDKDSLIASDDFMDGDSRSESDDSDNDVPTGGRWLRTEPTITEAPTRPRTTRLTKKPRERFTVNAPIPPSRPDFDDFLDMSDLTPENVKKKLMIIVERRGRKRNDRFEQISILKKLAEHTKDVDVQSFIDVLAQLIASEFDMSSGPTVCQSSESWLETFDHLSQILNLLETNPTAYISDITTPNTSTIEERDNTKTTISIFSAFLERLDDELYKALKFKDLHSDVYKVRLGHTIDLLMILSRFYEYVKKLGEINLITSICLRIFEQLYNKHNQLAVKTWELVKKRSPKPLDFLNTPTIDPEQLINEFYTIIAQNGKKREKVHAQLFLCYNKCLHDQYYEGRDLLQIPNMHEMCMQLDIHTQILYNRDLVQLGLAAFRKGYINEAFYYLADICLLNRQKELLAQGILTLKYQEKTFEQEKAEKRRLLPYHLHINLDLVEGVHNICAMLLEIPARAKNKYSTDYQISRQFSRLMEVHTHQPFQGPPENSRDLIMCATKALQKGDWKMCSTHIFELNIWDKFHQPEMVKHILLERIKLEAMRTYIFSYLNLYNSFSVTQLTSMFEVSKKHVHSVVSKMMVNEEILASWDENSENIIINRVEPTRLQQLALTLAEKISTAVEQNELTLNMKNPKFVLSYDRLQIFGDRQHWGIGPSDSGRRNRNQKKMPHTHGRYKHNNRNTNTKRFNQDPSLHYKPMSMRQVMA